MPNTKKNFYRRYRSQSFETIIGQEHVVQTLSNATTHQRLAQAYIFSGPRGTGKTSSARILAKAINCRKGMSNTPCLDCDLCQKITMSQSIDVIEMDAASHTSVDYIRTLNDQINFKPIECLYKIYIIDEAHMLSGGAFNALLKTIEEPPDNTLFILATTEPHRIPKTIHSRCQQLNFRKLTLNEIIQQLTIITEKESITISNNSLNAIARQADGCMRDAITLLDQLFSCKGLTIADNDLQFILGGHTIDALIHLLSLVASHDVGPIMQALDQLFLSGLNPTAFVKEWLQLLKLSLMLQSNLELKSYLTPPQIQALSTAIASTSQQKMQHYLYCFGQLLSDIKGFIHPELAIQIRFLEALDTQKNQPTTEEASPKKIPSPPETEKKITQKPTPAISKPASTAKEPSVQAPTPTITPIASPTETEAPDTIPISKNNTHDALWIRFLSQLKIEKYSLYTILSSATFHTVKEKQIEISFEKKCDFFIEKLNESSYQSIIEKTLKTTFQKPLQLSVIDEPSSYTQTTPLNNIIELFQGKVL